MGEQATAEEPRKPKTDEELKQIAQDLLAGKIFCDRHIPDDAPPRILLSVFKPIFFMGDDFRKLVEEENIEFIFEYLHKQTPRGVNGYPSFFSFQSLNGDETKKMFEFYEAIKAAVDAV